VLAALDQTTTAADDFLLAAAYTRSFWVLIGDWTVNIFSKENQTSSTFSRHRRRSDVLQHLTIRVRQQLRLLASENDQSQISLHNTSHRAARHLDNFFDFTKTFAGTKIVLSAA